MKTSKGSIVLNLNLKTTSASSCQKGTDAAENLYYLFDSEVVPNVPSSRQSVAEIGGEMSYMDSDHENLSQSA